LEKQWIKLSSLPYGSPIFFVQKKDGTLWMVMDYKTLNKNMVKNCYPLPHIDNFFDQLAYARIFSSFELAQGYHQIGVFSIK